MTILKINAFAGEIPRVPADRLPSGNAQKAENCNFAHGELRSRKALAAEWTAHTSARPVRTVFTDDGIRFFAWNKPTRAFLHPTIDDTARRVIYQEHGQGVRVAQTDTMRVSSLEPRPPTESWKIGVKRPVSAPSLSGPTPGPTDNAVTIAYVVVVVNIWGEESAPSDPAMIDVVEGSNVTLTIDHTPDADEQDIQGILIYRTYPSLQSADFYLLTETPITPVSGVSYSAVDATTQPNTTTVLQSEAWDTPPAAAGNLTYCGNGYFVVSVGKDLVFSEPYKPHAWPYRMTLPVGVVGIVPTEGGVLVTTQGAPFLINGAHPSQMSQQALAAEQAGWSDTAIARVEGSAIYASNDGLVTVYGGVPSLESSQAIFTRKDWRGRYGAARQNLRMIAHDGLVLGLIDPSYPAAAPSGVKPFMLDLDNPEGGICSFDVGQPIYGASVSGTTDVLYLGTATGFAEIEGGAGSLTTIWESGDIQFPAPVSFAAAIIDCTGSWTIRIWADDVEVLVETATARKPFRLPHDTPRALRWSVELTGTGTVRSFEMGASFAELKGA